MSALLEAVVVVVEDVGEHLHDLGLFLFETSDIQHKYSKFRDFQVIVSTKYRRQSSKGYPMKVD